MGDCQSRQRDREDKGLFPIEAPDDASVLETMVRKMLARQDRLYPDKDEEFIHALGRTTPKSLRTIPSFGSMSCADSVEVAKERDLDMEELEQVLQDIEQKEGDVEEKKDDNDDRVVETKYKKEKLARGKKKKNELLICSNANKNSNPFLKRIWNEM